MKLDPGGPVGKDMDEGRGREPVCLPGASGSRRGDPGGSSSHVGIELPTDQTVVESVSARRHTGPGAWECGKSVQPRQGCQAARARAATGAEALSRTGRGIRTNVGGRAFAGRSRHSVGRGNV